MKKGDYVICFGEGCHIGKISTEIEDGEFDVEFFDGGSVSPGNLDENIVVSEEMARFFAACQASIPADPEDDEQLYFSPDIRETYFEKTDTYSELSIK